jgi:hypothetical protein
MGGGIQDRHGMDDAAGAPVTELQGCIHAFLNAPTHRRAVMAPPNPDEDKSSAGSNNGFASKTLIQAAACYTGGVRPPSQSSS